MKIAGEYLISVPVDQTWSLLCDLERLVHLIPGVEVVSAAGDDVLCKVQVGIGTFSGEFAGKARFRDLDESRHHLLLDARTLQAADTGIVAVVALQLLPIAGHTRVVADTNLDVTGELAETDDATLRHAWDRLLRRSFERVDLAFMGPQSDPSVRDTFLKYAAAGVASAARTILRITGWRPTKINPPQDPL